MKILKSNDRFKLQGSENFEFIDPSANEILTFKEKIPNNKFINLEFALSCKPVKPLIISDLHASSNELSVHGNEIFLNCDILELEPCYTWPFIPLFMDCEYNTTGLLEVERDELPKVAYLLKDNTYDEDIPESGNGILISQIPIFEIPEIIIKMIEGGSDFFFWPSL